MKLKNLTHSLAAKIIAIFLAAVLAVVTVGVAFAVVALFSISGYDGTLNSAKKNIAESFLYKYSNYIVNDYYYGDAYLQSYNDANFYYKICDSDGNILISNYENQDVICIVNTTQSVSYKKSYDVTLYCKTEMSRNDNLSLALYWVEFGFKWRYVAIGGCFIGIILLLSVFVFLYCCAGHRSGYDEIVLNKSDKIPFDLFTGFFAAVFIGELLVLNEFRYLSDWEFLIFSAGVGILDFFLFIWYTMSISARVKCGVLIKNTIIYKLIALILLCLKKTGNIMLYLIRNIPFIWKAVLLTALISVFNLWTALMSNSNEMFILLLIETVILVPCTLFAIVALRKLEKGGQKIAQGNLDYHIDTNYMFCNFKKFGENLNSINLGMSKAVDEKIKSERFKTELITNVSHDIKTPLTSIINYVDLIKKESPENENIAEYVNILSRQSSRLKKLIEDLVEASKAATGNLPVNPAPCEVGILLSQMAGEYQEKLQSLGLELVMNQPKDPIKIMADGRHLWRIFDNLMNNICKYAQASTRVYLSLQKIENTAVITFRNISKYPLNISSEELMERFVRGDSSRNTEGSGLGLSIVKSLTELQNGELELTVDGDLFKVILMFDIIE